MKKILRVFLTLMLSMLFCVPVLNVVFAETGADTEAPLVTNAMFDKKSVNKPANEGATSDIPVKLSVVEEGTGIKHIQVAIYVYKNGSASPITIFADKTYAGDADSVYTSDVVVNVPISKSDASGVYKLGYIKITDNAGNVRTYFDHYKVEGYRKDSA